MPTTTTTTPKTSKTTNDTGKVGSAAPKAKSQPKDKTTTKPTTKAAKSGPKASKTRTTADKQVIKEGRKFHKDKVQELYNLAKAQAHEEVGREGDPSEATSVQTEDALKVPSDPKKRKEQLDGLVLEYRKEFIRQDEEAVTGKTNDKPAQVDLTKGSGDGSDGSDGDNSVKARKTPKPRLRKKQPKKKSSGDGGGGDDGNGDGNLSDSDNEGFEGVTTIQTGTKRTPWELALERCGFNTASINLICDKAFHDADQAILTHDLSLFHMTVKDLKATKQPKAVNDKDLTDEQRAEAMYRFPSHAITKLGGLLVWVHAMDACGLGFDVDHWNGRDYIMLSIAHYNKLVSYGHEDRTAYTEKPAKLTNIRAWKGFKQSFIEYLSQLRSVGFSGAPMDYTIRDHERPSPYMINQTRLDWDNYLRNCHLLRTNEPLVSDIIKQDLSRVWYLLSSLTLGTQYHHFVDHHRKTKDGRAAFKALKQQAEGEQQMDILVEEARHKVRSSHWDGSSKNFSLAEYVKNHSESHQTLADQGQPMYDTEKVGRFLDGIKNEKLRIHKTLVETDDKMRDNFMLAQAYITSAALKLKLEARKEQRRIAAAKRRDDKNKNGGGKGNDGGKKNDNKPKSKSDKDKGKETELRLNDDGSIYTGSYSRSQWRGLGKEKQQKVIAERKRKERTVGTVSSLVDSDSEAEFEASPKKKGKTVTFTDDVLTQLSGDKEARERLIRMLQQGPGDGPAKVTPTKETQYVVGDKTVGKSDVAALEGAKPKEKPKGAGTLFGKAAHTSKTKSSEDKIPKKKGDKTKGSSDS